MAARDGEGDRSSDFEDGNTSHQSKNRSNGRAAKPSISELALGANDAALRGELRAVQLLQGDSATRVRELNEDGQSGSASNDGRLESPSKMKRSITEKDVDEEIYAYRSSLENSALFLDTAMKDLLQRKIRRDCTHSQTESTAITAQDAEAQTDDVIAEDDHRAEKLLFSLPDLDEEIANLSIDMETQTDLQMDHFSADAAHNKHHRDKNVVIIYRNPSMSSFLPYLVTFGSVTLGCLALYGIARFAIYLRIRPHIVTADVPS